MTEGKESMPLVLIEHQQCHGEVITSRLFLEQWALVRHARHQMRQFLAEDACADR